MKSSRVREIQDCAKRAGVRIASMTQGKAHIQIILENGRKVFASMTPSDWRSGRKLIKDMKHEWKVTDKMAVQPN